MHKLPLIAPQPPRLSEMTEALQALEARGVYSNGGPLVREFETRVVAELFGGQGAALAVNNATIGLILAIRQAAEGRKGKYALIPSFTFAATAHAAIWGGLTPILIDSDPANWAASAEAEEAALARHAGEIAVLVPYDTFGTCIDLARYARLSEQHGVGVVVDAAASLGSLDAAGHGFGTGAGFASVFSLHATKTFATAEGGLIYSADEAQVEALRTMHNFGFGAPRSATMPGTNAKLPEVLGLLALAKLDEIDAVAKHRAELDRAYRSGLEGDVTFQAAAATRQVAQFMPMLLPAGTDRAAVMAELAAQGIGSGHYFAPHLAQQPYFQRECVVSTTPVADDLAARMLSLPVTDAMRESDVATICEALRAALRKPRAAVPAAKSDILSTVLIGGGPAGVAFLISASKKGKLRELAAGLAVIERRPSLGAGELPGYAITSDSTAETFLSAVKDNPEPSIAALMDHPASREVAQYIGKLGVPLSRTGPFLEAMGQRVGAVVTEAGGSVLTGHEVLDSRRTAAGLWQTRIRDVATGTERELLSQNIVIATGGYQSPTSVAAAPVAGTPLRNQVGERLMLCDDMLRAGGMERLRERIADKRAPRIAIIGASTSAIASAVLLLKSDIPFGAESLSLLHREALRPWYPNAEAAHADGFIDFGPDDICPLSGFVYRLAGFRLEARELVLRMLRIGGRTPDPRVRLHQLGGPNPETTKILAEADVVVAALGYRPHALTLLDAAGQRIALAAHAPGRPRLADQLCRVTDAEGHPLPGAYGIGLAAGFVPEGRLGGEKSFKGKANGLWQWQNDVGQLIVDQLLGQAVSLAA
ncbi:aminotransferase class I/II-fold pyridoxal phosphate-dependent enzyme [Sphingomonas sp. R-74633]|uniref:aminotransferase class I/II-fold pyridoxal phosphate-dependent enzyme n=1 Tax=Sphingomonas sp. R-74633 TaxID=2751188 RepID=UPI0015D23904|nr:aminotransferase class I/II-fold pyridoxal phosphate-dependent enzyme [Sphingomonas sp. R-74633]NYT39370.1 aminotransferase class I/II-fold pyridoxal phosphate-dependent enzyme [Sphingomonas sp. R-74633]